MVRKLPKRGFCTDCGSPIVFLYEGNPNVWVLVGSLDHPGDWPLTKDARWGQSAHWYIETKVPWYEITDGLPQDAGGMALLLILRELMHHLPLAALDLPA